jgi:L-serine/L-threonine ammonia-lyase
MMLASQLHAVTPLIESVSAGARLGCAVLLKLENTQPSGSYKLRGMGYKGRLAVQRGATHFVASSGGNAGLAVAWAARALGVQATVVVPSSTPEFARRAIESFGATARVHGDVYAQADALARELAAGADCEYFSAYDDPELWTGHASMMEEVQQQLGGVKPSAVVVSVGGGGLMCGVVEGLHKVGWRDVPVVAMETTGADCFHLAQKAGELVEIYPTSMAKSLGASVAAAQTLVWDAEHTIHSVVIEDRTAVEAAYEFAADHRLIVEPACGAALAIMYDRSLIANLSGGEDMLAQGPIVVVCCGGSMATPSLLQDWKDQVDVANASPAANL